MGKEQRATKWAFIIYRESVPSDYKQILNEIHIPYMLSPWHDKDIDPKTGETKKAHKHGVLYFERLKSYSQVVEILKPLKGPPHIEIVHSVKGMYDYFIHADSPSKAPYNIENIEYGCGFDLSGFLASQNKDGQINKILNIIDKNNVDEFEDLVKIVRGYELSLLDVLSTKTYFFSKYLDSKRYKKQQAKGDEYVK